MNEQPQTDSKFKVAYARLKALAEKRNIKIFEMEIPKNRIVGSYWVDNNGPAIGINLAYPDERRKAEVMAHQIAYHRLHSADPVNIWYHLDKVLWPVYEKPDARVDRFANRLLATVLCTANAKG